MQTFLPYDDFARSARVLDSARLGKQRLEGLQALRALVLPVYGWSTHPAARMWRGHVPALVRYTTTVIDEWTERGNVDAIRPMVVEFAPLIDGTPEEELDQPAWMGSAELHDSHRSNLVRKVPEYYGPFFPDVPDDLPYFWPESHAPMGADVADSTGRPLAILRARTVGEYDEWVATGVVTLPARSPNGTRSAAWTKQHNAFAALSSGDRLGVLHPGVQRCALGIAAGGATAYESEQGDGLRLSVEFEGEVGRDAFPTPVLLQDARVFFSAPGPS